MKSHHEEDELVAYRRSAWTNSNSFTDFIYSTGSRAALDFFMKDDRGNDRAGINNRFVKRKGMLDEPTQSEVDYRATQNKVGYSRIWDKVNFDNMEFYSEEVESNFFFPVKMVVDHAIENDRDLSTLNPFDIDFVEMFQIDDENAGFYKSLIDMPGGTRINMYKTIPDDFYEHLWDHVDEIEKELLPKAADNSTSWYELMKKNWIGRESDEKDKDGKPLLKIDKKAVIMFLGIDDDKIARGTINHAAGMYKSNSGIGKLGLNVTRKQRDKYMKEGIAFFTDQAINGTENAKRGIIGKINMGGFTTNDWIFNKKMDCKLLRLIRDNSNDDETLNRVDQSFYRCKRD